jgi:hypothetical protein
MTHVTQVLLNPEKPSAARVDQPVLSSLVALVGVQSDLCQSLEVWMASQKQRLGSPA